MPEPRRLLWPRDYLRDTFGFHVQGPSPVNWMGILDKVDHSLEKVPEIVEAVHGNTGGIFDLVRQSEQTLREVEQALQAVRQHWLLRRYMEPAPPEGDGWLRPEELRKAGER